MKREFTRICCMQLKLFKETKCNKESRERWSHVIKLRAPKRTSESPKLPKSPSFSVTLAFVYIVAEATLSNRRTHVKLNTAQKAHPALA